MNRLTVIDRQMSCSILPPLENVRVKEVMPFYVLDLVPQHFGYYMYITGPVGSIIYADLYGSIKIKFTVLIRDTDQ